MRPSRFAGARSAVKVTRFRKRVRATPRTSGGRGKPFAPPGPLNQATEAAVEREHEVEFDEFFASTYPSIVRSASLVVGDQEVARELAQDAFVKALLHWKRVRTYEHPQAWVRKVVFRMALRAKRSAVPHELI